MLDHEKRPDDLLYGSILEDLNVQCDIPREKHVTCTGPEVDV